MKWHWNAVLIDDDESINLIHRIILKKAFPKIEVEEFTDPVAAIEHFEALTELHERTIIFLDLNMPELNGFEFLERFNNLREKIKGRVFIYVLTASQAERDKERVKRSGMIQAYLNKPLTNDTVYSIDNKVSLMQKVDALR